MMYFIIEEFDNIIVIPKCRLGVFGVIVLFNIISICCFVLTFKLVRKGKG